MKQKKNYLISVTLDLKNFRLLVSNILYMYNMNIKIKNTKKFKALLSVIY